MARIDWPTGTWAVRRCAEVLDEDRSDAAVDFWNQVICRSFGAFARTNRLFSDLEQHLGAGFTPQ